MKIEWLGFGDPIGKIPISIAALTLERAHRLQSPVNLVSRGEDNWRSAPAPPTGFQDVEGSQRIDLEVTARVAQRRGHRHLTGKVIDHVDPPYGGLNGTEIPDIVLDEREM